MSGIKNVQAHGKSEPSNRQWDKFKAPFLFVFKSGYYGGLLTQCLAIYASYILLGMIPFAMIPVAGRFFGTLSGSSITNFYNAACLFIALNLLQRSLDMMFKMQSRYLANKQQSQVSRTINASIRKTPKRAKAYNRFTSEEIRELKRDLTNKILENKSREGVVDYKLTDEDYASVNDELKKVQDGQNDKFGSKATDQSKVYEMINKISEQLLQSIASITTNIFFLVSIGMTRYAIGILSSTVVVNMVIISYALNHIKPIDKEAGNLKFSIRSQFQKFYLIDEDNDEAVTKRTHEIADTNFEYIDNHESKVDDQIGKDFMVDLFNNCIRYCALPLGIFIAVNALANGVFPLTDVTLVTGAPLTAALILATATPIEKIIQDTSVFAKSYQELYQSGSNYENLETLMKRGWISEKQMFVSKGARQSITRGKSLLKHIIHHGLFGLTVWAVVSTVVDLSLSYTTGSSIALTVLMPTILMVAVGLIGQKHFREKSHGDVYDYVINIVFSSILTITTIIAVTNNPLWYASLSNIVPTVMQKVHFVLGISSLFYTLASAATFMLKPSEKELNVLKDEAKIAAKKVNASCDLVSKKVSENLVSKNKEPVSWEPQGNQLANA